jgi:hypothetical protein
MGLRERTSLLLIIAALAGEADIDITKASKAAETIANLVEKTGHQLATTTIAGHLRALKKHLLGERDEAS